MDSDTYLDKDKHMGDVSIGSTGGLHESRNLHIYLIYLLGFYSQLIFLIAGLEVGKLFPDFLIVKVEPQSIDKPRQYLIVEIVEVKHDDETLISSFKQVAKYLQCAYSHPLHDPSLCAHLVMRSSSCPTASTCILNTIDRLSSGRLPQIDGRQAPSPVVGQEGNMFPAIS